MNYTTWRDIIYGGNGGYAKAELQLVKSTTLYIYVGGKGGDRSGAGNTQVAGGWNGGAVGDWDRNDYNTFSGGGGGATDIRVTNGSWNNAQSLYSRIIVAGGGGGAHGAANNATTAQQRGLAGTRGGNVSKTGEAIYQWTGNVTWMSSGLLGQGKNSATSYDGGEAGGGGGGGYYGGDCTASGHSSAGSGGTSYITGCSGCDTTYQSYQKINGVLPVFKNIDFQQGVNADNGKATITML